MFSLLLLLPALAFAWPPGYIKFPPFGFAPGIPLERQIPVKMRQGWSSGYGYNECDFEPYYQECNSTEIWCDMGYYNDDSCWLGNYCLQQVSDWDGCPGVCHTPCNWETEDYCDMGTKTFGHNECWVGNWCQDKSYGGCPSTGNYGEYGYGESGYGEYGFGEYGSGDYEYGSSCSEAYTTDCDNNTEISCDAGYDSRGCWYGNYCIQQVSEYDGCHGVCGPNCNYETEDWCEYGYDSNGCWMGAWCQDKSMGGCPPPHGGSELASGEDVCAHVTPWIEDCNGNQTYCDLGYSREECWFGNYCIEDWDCPSVCLTMCDPTFEEWVDYGYDENGCWLGNTCQPIGATAPSADYSGFYSGDYSGFYSGDYSGDYSGFYSGDYSGDYSGFYSGDYSGAAPSADYSGVAPSAAPSAGYEMYQKVMERASADYRMAAPSADYGMAAPSADYGMAAPSGLKV